MRYVGTFLATGLILTAGCQGPKRSAFAETPGALARILKQGVEAETRGDGLGAAAAYERAAREFADYATSWAHLGEHRRFWGRDPAAAEEAFRRAIDAPFITEASIAYAWRGLGEVARGRGEVDRAIACFEKSLSIRPLVDAHRSLSALYATERRDFERAARHAQLAVALSPDDPIALIQLAVQMVRYGKKRDAEETFDKAIRLAECDELGRSAGLVHCCVLYNGACYHAVRGEKAKALAMLEEFFRTPNHRHITREEIVRDPDFESLAGDPDFTALLGYRLPEE